MSFSLVRQTRNSSRSFVYHRGITVFDRHDPLPVFLYNQKMSHHDYSPITGGHIT